MKELNVAAGLGAAAEAEAAGGWLEASSADMAREQDGWPVQAGGPGGGDIGHYRAGNFSHMGWIVRAREQKRERGRTPNTDQAAASAALATVLAPKQLSSLDGCPPSPHLPRPPHTTRNHPPPLAAASRPPVAARLLLHGLNARPFLGAPFRQRRRHLDEARSQDSRTPIA